jgi:hypothetical protein
MKSIKCPHCHGTIVGAIAAFSQQEAIKKVLKIAKKPTNIERLASIYMAATNCTHSSARRAIERLATNGYLRRVKPAWYQNTIDAG